MPSARETKKAGLKAASAISKKNFLNGLEITEFDAINPAARIWLDSIANVRIHGETKQRPVDLFQSDKASLGPLPSLPNEIGTIMPVRASSQFRVSFESNRYSVPAEFSSSTLTLKVSPDHICIYHQDRLVARHVRSFDRHRDFENPDHPRELLAYRRKAREQKIMMRFLAISPKTQDYYQELATRRFNPNHHIQKIVALSEIYGNENVAKAIEDALYFQAFSSEYINNILEQRARQLPEPSALHLTRRQDLLEIEVPEPNLKIYDES